MTNMRVLVVEDDPTLLRAVRDAYEKAHYQTDGTGSGDEGFDLAQERIHDLLVLDIMLPGMNGVEMVRKLKATSNPVPVILLTALDAVDERIAGLDAGADDYIVKPFSLDELLARSRAVLRRCGTIGADGDLIYGPLRIISANRRAYFENKELSLTITEYKLLEYFISHKNQLLTREQIFDRIWGFNSSTSQTAVDVYVHYLRKKLMKHRAGGLIRTVRGVGYMMGGGEAIV
ncbi:response regulator transcription factor [Paenibacillus silvisoli]|uniref:response regulator transcription factor n=1 Tax=Paenibacillus silvisoli TaxID=3110539 RepID=UPI0028050F5E|nr:response regulator transcription factor [Paenibacillus silvisoli]